jgi:hypothetical protein
LAGAFHTSPSVLAFNTGAERLLTIVTQVPGGAYAFAVLAGAAVQAHHIIAGVFAGSISSNGKSRYSKQRGESNKFERLHKLVY